MARRRSFHCSQAVPGEVTILSCFSYVKPPSTPVMAASSGLRTDFFCVEGHTNTPTAPTPTRRHARAPANMQRGDCHSSAPPSAEQGHRAAVYLARTYLLEGHQNHSTTQCKQHTQEQLTSGCGMGTTAATDRTPKWPWGHGGSSPALFRPVVATACGPVYQRLASPRAPLRSVPPHTPRRQNRSGASPSNVVVGGASSSR